MSSNNTISNQFSPTPAGSFRGKTIATDWETRHPDIAAWSCVTGAGGSIDDTLRRVFDILVALTALILTAPILFVIAMSIRLDSPGPALFFQRRLGKERRNRSDHETQIDPENDRRRTDLGNQFSFVKFRTMNSSAKSLFPELYEYDYDEAELQTVRFKVENDPRVTRVGAWLRRTSLDELPNFWNVLVGNMTLVGPRPEIPEMRKYYTEAQQLKFSVKPGVTGPAQVYGRGLLSFQNTVRLDVSYVQKRNLKNDYRLFVKTIQCVLKADGAF